MKVSVFMDFLVLLCDWQSVRFPGKRHGNVYDMPINVAEV